MGAWGPQPVPGAKFSGGKELGGKVKQAVTRISKPWNV